VGVGDGDGVEGGVGVGVTAGPPVLGGGEGGGLSSALPQARRRVPQRSILATAVRMPFVG
jgi:hypothetical protein